MENNRVNSKGEKSFYETKKRDKENKQDYTSCSSHKLIGADIFSLRDADALTDSSPVTCDCAWTLLQTRPSEPSHRTRRQPRVCMPNNVQI